MFKGIRFTQILTLTLALVLGFAAASAAAADQKKSRDPKGYEARLVKRVRHELVMLPYYSVFDNLTFQIKEDTVILGGQVSRPSLRSDAEHVVKKIEDVRAVVNNIEVLPVSPMDDRLRVALYRSIFGFAGLGRYSLGAVPSIHIIVNNGHVTLEGVVDNQTDKNLAGLRANQVPGIFSVTNNLIVTKT